MGTKKPPSEAQMRGSKVETPHTLKELTDYVNALVERQHDYGTCVYAMSMAATAAFKYVAHKLGVTGFQASCADMDIIRRTRNLERFMILDAEKWLYPQYDPQGEVDKFRAECTDWLRDAARRKLRDSAHAHPNVLAHWKKLAGVRQ